MISRIKQLVTFFHESRDELKKVTWPDREEVTCFTVVVVLTLIIFSIFLWLVDMGLMTLIRVVTK